MSILFTLIMWCGRARTHVQSAALCARNRLSFHCVRIAHYQSLTYAKTVHSEDTSNPRIVACQSVGGHTNNLHHNNKSVAEFYAGKSVFITGGTGFLGKVFIEKLLYSCTDIDKIYILIRNKKSKTAQERIKELTEKPLFSRLKQERPGDLSKIIPVSGDITEPNLGIKPEDEQVISEKVSIVFHVAATIKFNEKLDVAVNANVEGTRRVLNLCRRMNHLKAFVHLSTAYTNCDRKVIDEVVYPPPVESSEVYNFLRLHGVDDEDKVNKMLHGRPNTYIFTKCLTETLIAETHGDIPAVIVRPSIVTAAVHEPVEGWIDTWMGATPVITSTAKGFNRVLFADKNNTLDMIPVDYVSNLSIVAASRCKRSEAVTVYNSCSSSCNPITLEKLTRLTIDYVTKHGYNDIPYPMLILTRKKWVNSSATFLLQIVPAFVADVWLRIKGKSPKYVKLQLQMIRSRDALEYFTSHSWVMRCERVVALSASLCAHDRQLFPFDPTNIDWSHYIPIYYEGIKNYLLKK